MKPTLQFRLSQHLTLTPQLQQSIRLLQLSTVELNQEIERMLMDNPILEREDAEGESAFVPLREAPAAPAAEAASEASAPEEGAERAADWQLEFAAPSRAGEDDDEGDRAFGAAGTPSLREHLNEQLALTGMGERDRALTALLIDVLDDDGYLTQPLEEIAALFEPAAAVDVEETSALEAPHAEMDASAAAEELPTDGVPADADAEVPAEAEVQG